jgi:hypothetical protein
MPKPCPSALLYVVNWGSVRQKLTRSARLGHVAIIDRNLRRGEKLEFTPAEAVRYRERSTAERVNAHLHDGHGGRHVRVRGTVKVAALLAFGLVVIAAEQMLKALTAGSVVWVNLPLRGKLPASLLAGAGGRRAATLTCVFSFGV